ncbi:MAG: hypothetical protein P8M78_04700 [Myxococcota bacterium]|nr:hypothetical protein [Myxococcota bacterium]
MKQIIPWLGGIALLFFCALPASAWTIRATFEPFHPDENGITGPGIITVGPLGVSYRVHIDLNTNGGTDLFALGVGFLFEGSGFTYDQGASSTNTYLLYSSAKNAYLVPASTCGNTSGDGCNLYLTNPNQVQLDFLSTKVGQGLPAAGIPTASDGFENLATLVFTSISPGTFGFLFSFDPITGGVLGLADGTSIVPEFEYAVVPEPQTALLVGLGCALLAQARRNRIRTAAAPAVNGEPPAPRA